MTENTTGPSNVMEHVKPRQPAVGGGSQAKEGIGLTTAKKKKRDVAVVLRWRKAVFLVRTIEGGIPGENFTTIIMINMRMPVQQYSFTHQRVLYRYSLSAAILLNLTWVVDRQSCPLLG
jgi:hypothetical protein